MTPSVLMRSTSHKRDFTQGDSGFFFFFRVQEDFSVSAEARSPMPDATNDEVTRKNTLKTWPKPETASYIWTVSGTQRKEIPALLEWTPL